MTLLSGALALAGLWLGLRSAGAGGWMDRESAPPATTFSIVAFDPATGELGVAVQSKLVGVGAIVPWAEAGVGAVATQALANPTWGPRGLDALRRGEAPRDVVESLARSDPDPASRQLGVVDARGRAASYTGASCLSWAGDRQGPHYAVQGNLLAGAAVVDEMARAFEAAEGDLGDRMLAALAAGQRAGGDRRGKQAAALLIVREGWGYAGLNDRYRDLRVDDHPDPIRELHRIYKLHQQAFPRPKPQR